METTADLIKEAREIAGTRAKLSKTTGISNSFLYQLEKGIRKRLKPQDYAEYWPELAETRKRKFTYDSTANHANRFAR